MAHSVFTSAEQEGGAQVPVVGLGTTLLALAGLGLLSIAIMVEHETALLLATVGASLLAICIILALFGWLQRVLRRAGLRRVARFIDNDSAPGFVADAGGRLIYVNAAGKSRFASDEPMTLGQLLQDVFANPQVVLARLQARAASERAASEDIVTRRGHMRLSVFRLPPDGYLWRIEEIGTGPARSHGGANLPMITVGRGNVILYMNDAARDFCGHRMRSLETVFPDLPLKNDFFNIALARDGRRNCLVHEVAQNGGRREIYFFPLGDGDGAGTLAEMTLDGLPVAILRLDADGTVLGGNHAARDLLDFSTTVPTKLQELLEDPGRPISDWLSQTINGTAHNRSEFLRVKGRDDDLYLQVSLARLEEAEGHHLSAVLSDATELKSLEHQFAQSQKMQAIGELAGGVAHDFNNLLTAISGHCDLLLLRHQTEDPDYADLIQISQNANRAAALVGQLLAFSRKQTLRPVAVDIREALSDLTHLLNRLVGEKITLTLFHDPDPWTIRADRRQLEQVLMNLIVNARDAMPCGGEIHIETSNLTLSEPLERDQVAVPEGDYLMIRVADEGAGIPPERLQKIFQPFFTTKRTGEGTGLGLSTVYGIVKQSGGYVFVDSVLGKGTKFSLLFPAHEPEQDVEEEQPDRDTPRRVVAGDGVVLLVEDEAPVRAFASRALRLSGFTVIEAADAEEALEILKDPALQVDVFVTDVIMPGKDGPTWVKEALQDRPEARVVFVSGYAEDAFDGRKADFRKAQFLPKPFSLEELRDTVQEQLL